MNRTINKCISVILVLLIIVSTVVVRAAEIGGMSVTDAAKITGDDNWGLSLVFYDSSVDGGKTALDSIDWNITDLSYNTGQSRIITVQVTYSNTNAVTTYNSGDLTITVPNLVYGHKSADAQWSVSSIQVSTINPEKPDDPNEVWTFMDGNTAPTENQQTFTFTNNQSLEELANFEGSFQIQYTIVSLSETPEKYDEGCTHEYAKDLQAVLTETSQNSTLAESNTLDFNYKRVYEHPWEKIKYTIKKNAGKPITSYDGLGAGADDYIWVRYEFSVTRSQTTGSYPYIECNPLNVLDQFPENCVVYDSTGKRVEPENGLLKSPNVTFNAGSKFASLNYIVGYPKDTYNEENDTLEIDNTADLWGHYLSEEEAEWLDDDTVHVNLADFAFSYPPGEIFGIIKSGETYFEINYKSLKATNKNLRYKSIIENDERNMIRWTITGIANYRGDMFTVDIGDDLVYHTGKNNAYQRTADDEYYFKNIVVPPMKNGNDMAIPAGKYKYDVYVRYSGESNRADEYVKFNDEPYLNSASSQTITFPDNNVVAWFVRIHDMEESLKNLAITSDMYFTADDIPTSGRIYNFDYIKGYSKDDDGNLTLLNGWTEDNYNNFITKDEIASYDQENHDAYIQRAVSSKEWEPYTIVGATARQQLSKERLGYIILSSGDEYFYGEFKVTDKLSAGYDGTASRQELFEQLEDDDFFTDFTFYDLVPEGMELLSSKEEILETITALSYQSNSVTTYVNFYDTNGEQAFATNDEATEFFKERSTVTIIRDWRGTGRTLIKIAIDFKDRPLFCYGSAEISTTASITVRSSAISFQYKFGVPFDSFLSLGNTYKNYAYLQSEDMSTVSSKISDDGRYDAAASDITDDGNTDDLLAYANANAVINYLVSTHQDVTKFVLTDKIDDYKTGSAQSSPGAEYSYKIRVRSGQSDTTNLVIYDSIEEKAKDKDGNIVSAYGDNEYWQGGFLGVDTSFADARTYTVIDRNNPTGDKVLEKIDVKVWYSESAEPGGLYTKDQGYSSYWKEYPKDDDSGIDKSRVKSLAFEFLDENGNRAILPSNVSTYVLIKMKAPADEEITTMAYNGAWTQWQALDEHAQPVEFITGINSNIVKVALNEVIDVPVTKTWKDDKEECRPKEIKIVLLQDGIEYGEAVISSDSDWKYTFDGLPRYRKDGTEYEYSVKEIYDEEGYQTQYKEQIGGLRIKFNELTEVAYSYNYIEIFYELDGVAYSKGQYKSKDLSNATVEVPADNFYIYLCKGSSWGSDAYFGFLIDSITPISGGGITPGTESGSIPNLTPVECIADEYPESAHNPHESVSKLWHYTYKMPYDAPHPGAYNIVNTGAFINIQGTKSWAEDITEHPESITVNLLRDGEVYRTADVTAESEWKYIFEGLPEFREDGSKYEYSVEEEFMEGYTPLYGTSATGLAIKFNGQSETEGTSTVYDYVYIYYELDGVIYQLGKYGGKGSKNNIANTIVEIPTDNFWLYWHTDSSGNSYYGFSIDYIERIDKETVDVSKAVKVSALPNYEIKEVDNDEYPESLHSPYENNTNDLWYYTASVDWTETPQTGSYDILNTSYVEEPPEPPELPNTGGNGLYLCEIIGFLCAAAGIGLIAERKKKKAK